MVDQHETNKKIHTKHIFNPDLIKILSQTNSSFHFIKNPKKQDLKVR